MQYNKIVERNGKKFYWSKEDLHTHHGAIKEKDIKTKSKVNSSKNREFTVYPAGFKDNVFKLKKGPQSMMLKDIAHILIYNDINKTSKVLEAGSGSGYLTSYLAKYAKKVYSYEIKKENLNLAKKNTESLNLKNITFKNQDITEKISEKDFDTIILDIPEPEKALENCYRALKTGGYLTAYLPNMTQVSEFVNQAKELFSVEEVLDILAMPWHVDNKKAKPQPKDMLHTAFLIFCRKI